MSEYMSEYMPDQTTPHALCEGIAVLMDELNSSLDLKPPKTLSPVKEAEEIMGSGQWEYGEKPDELNIEISESRAARQVSETLKTDPRGPEMNRVLTYIEAVGSTVSATMESRSGGLSTNRDRSNAGNEFSFRHIQKVASVKDAGVRTLESMRSAIRELNPSMLTRGRRKFMGIIPFGRDPLDEYLELYETKSTFIEDRVAELEDIEIQLRSNNAILNVERITIWKQIGQLNLYIYELETYVKELRTELSYLDPSVADQYDKTAIRDANQKIMALLQYKAVLIQFWESMGIIIENNSELIRGVTMAKTTTISSIRTAAITAQALKDQEVTTKQLKEMDSQLNKTSKTMNKVAGRGPDTLFDAKLESIAEKMSELESAFKSMSKTVDEASAYTSQSAENNETILRTLERGPLRDQ